MEAVAMASSVPHAGRKTNDDRSAFGTCRRLICATSYVYCHRSTRETGSCATTGPIRSRPGPGKWDPEPSDPTADLLTSDAYLALRGPQRQRSAFLQLLMLCETRHLAESAGNPRGTIAAWLPRRNIKEAPGGARGYGRLFFLRSRLVGFDDLGLDVRRGPLVV